MENLSKSQSLAKRKLRKIQDTGITAFVIGVFFLFSPLFSGSNKILKPLAENLSSTVSWTFILIGVGLIGLYALLKQIKPKDKSVEVVKTTKSRTKSKPVGLLTTSTTYQFKKSGNGLYIFNLKGDLIVNEQLINTRDGLGIWDTDSITITAESDAEFLMMEVPMAV